MDAEAVTDAAERLDQELRAKELDETLARELFGPHSGAIGLTTTWSGMAMVKREMNARGWWFSLRDAGNGTDIDAIFFWAKNWRRDGRARGRPGEEALVVAEAAWKALKSAPVPE